MPYTTGRSRSTSGNSENGASGGESDSGLRGGSPFSVDDFDIQLPSERWDLPWSNVTSGGVSSPYLLDLEGLHAVPAFPFYDNGMPWPQASLMTETMGGALLPPQSLYPTSLPNIPPFSDPSLYQLPPITSADVPSDPNDDVRTNVAQRGPPPPPDVLEPHFLSVGERNPVDLI